MAEVKKVSRQKSVMSIQSNPLENGATNNIVNLKIENLNDAVLISNEQLSTLLTDLKKTESNEERLKIIDSNKAPFLFTSEGLSKLLDITTSLKTKIAIIQAVGPRLTDPRAKTEYFLGLFRFTEEKQTVEEILKARTHTMSAAVFNKGDQLKVLTAGRGGSGRGGAGRGPGVAGRGRGAGGPASNGGRGNVSDSSVVKPADVSDGTTTTNTKTVQFETGTTINIDTVAPVLSSVEVHDSTGPMSMRLESPLVAQNPTPPMSPPPYSKAVLCATPETPAQPVVSSGIDDVFDMLDRLPINPDAPLVMSAQKELRRTSLDPTMTSIREETDDDSSSLRNTPVDEVLSSRHDGTPLARALHSPVSSDVPETHTPRSDSGSTTLGDFSPYSPDASVNAQAERRLEVTPSPAMREETVFETESLKMIVETCKSSHKTSIRLETRVESASSLHYHEATGELSRSRMNSMDVASVLGDATTTPSGLATLLSPSSTLAAAADTPRTYDRAAMMRRLQAGGTTASTESDYSSPIVSPAPPSNKHPQTLGVDVNRVLFDGLAPDGIRSPSVHSKILNLGSLNGSPRRYDNLQHRSESADSSGSDNISASSQLDSRTQRTEKLEGYFDKPRVHAVSPDVAAQKALVITPEILSAPVVINSSPKVSGITSKKPISYIPSMAPPSYIASTTNTNNNDSRWRSRISTAVQEEDSTTPLQISTNIASLSGHSTGPDSSKLPFATPSKRLAASSFDLSEASVMVSVDFAALRNAFAKNEGVSGSKQYSRKMSIGASASFYISNSVSNNMNTQSAPTTTNDLSTLSASPLPKSESVSSPMLFKAHSTNNLTKASQLRRHTDFGLSSKTSATLLENDSQKVTVANVVSLGSDVASKCAAALKMDKTAFSALTLEEGWESCQPDGAVAMFYSYQELVRRNFTKQYVDLTQSELEKYLSDEEFAVVFQKNKDQFFVQPRWKQMDQKKRAMLF